VVVTVFNKLLTHTPLVLYVGEPNLQVSAKDVEGKTVKITGERPGPFMLHTFLSFSTVTTCRLYKSTISDQAQNTLQLTVGLSDLM